MSFKNIREGVWIGILLLAAVCALIMMAQSYR